MCDGGLGRGGIKGRRFVTVHFFFSTKRMFESRQSYIYLFLFFFYTPGLEMRRREFGGGGGGLVHLMLPSSHLFPVDPLRRSPTNISALFFRSFFFQFHQTKKQNKTRFLLFSFVFKSDRAEKPVFFFPFRIIFITHRNADTYSLSFSPIGRLFFHPL